MKIPHSQIVVTFFCLALMTLGCGGDDQAVREAATTQVLESMPAQPAEQTATDPPTSPQAQTPPDQQPVQPTAQPKEYRPKMAGMIKMAISGGSVPKGGVACVALSANNFKSIVSMQYTIKWDPKVLKFKELKSFGLPGLSADNFGKHILDKGLLTYSWFDATVKGISKGEGEALYEICFDAIGASGSKSAVQIIESPTVIEIANVNSEFYTLDATPGTVLVK